MAVLALVMSHLAALGGAATLPPPDVAAVAEVRFLDGGVERVLIRHEPARADGRTRATFADPATGRTADVTVGAEAILVGTSAQIARVVADHAVVFVRELMPSRGIVLVRSAIAFEDGALLAARLAPLVHTGALEEAYPDLGFRHRRLDVSVPPNDTRYGGQYYFDEINLEAAWAYSTGDPSVLIVVNDNGCDLSHPDLVDKLEPGFDPFEDDDDPSWMPGQGAEHGTACAGLVGATTDNDRDIAGTCPECRVACARILPADDEAVPLSYDVLTFQFAFGVGAAVVSNSWGFRDAIPVPAALASAIIDVQQYGRGGQGAVVTFAAGNDSRAVYDDELLAVPGILGVGALNNVGELTQYSNSGRSVDVVAVTGSLTLDISGPEGADPGDVTSGFGGTSSATPIVSGVAGLIASAAPDLTADEINAILIDTARQTALADPDENGHDLSYGYGVVQADAAMERALGIDDDNNGNGEGEPSPDDPATCAHTRVSGGVPWALGVLVLAFRRRRAQ